MNNRTIIFAIYYVKPILEYCNVIINLDMLEIVGRYNILIAVMRACMSYQHIITHQVVEVNLISHTVDG